MSFLYSRSPLQRYSRTGAEFDGYKGRAEAEAANGTLPEALGRSIGALPCGGARLKLSLSMVGCFLG